MGRDKRNEKKVIGGSFTAMPHYILDCAAYHALNPLARCIYWHLHRLAGITGQKNGALFYSVRSAAADHGVAPNTAVAAFRQLQAKGFIIPAEIGHLGVEGMGKATSWYLTHFPRPGMLATKDFLKWSPGNDFPVVKKQKPVSATDTPCINSCDVLPIRTPIKRRACINSCDVSGNQTPAPVSVIDTYKDIPSGGGAGRKATNSGRPERVAHPKA